MTIMTVRGVNDEGDDAKRSVSTIADSQWKRGERARRADLREKERRQAYRCNHAGSQSTIRTKILRKTCVRARACVSGQILIFYTLCNRQNMKGLSAKCYQIMDLLNEWNTSLFVFDSFIYRMPTNIRLQINVNPNRI